MHHSQFVHSHNFSVSVPLAKHDYQITLGDSHSPFLASKSGNFPINYMNTMRIAFVVVFSAIVIVVLPWCWTYKLVTRHRKAIQTNQVPSNTQNVSQKKILKSTITTLAIAAGLIACYFFALCFMMFRSFINRSELGHNTYEFLWSVAKTLMYVNCLVNPSLVFWRNSGFREAAKNIFN